MVNPWVKSINKRDLGMLVSKDLKFSRQWLIAKNKANLILSIINKGSYKSFEVISKLYRLNVRLHLEYCIQFWTSMNTKDADMLKEWQRMSTKLIPSLRKLTCHMRRG